MKLKFERFPSSFSVVLIALLLTVIGKPATASCDRAKRILDHHEARCASACNHCRGKGYIQERACLKLCRNYDQPLKCTPVAEAAVRFEACKVAQHFAGVAADIQRQIDNLKNRTSIEEMRRRAEETCRDMKESMSKSCRQDPSSQGCYIYRQVCLEGGFERSIQEAIERNLWPSDPLPLTQALDGRCVFWGLSNRCAPRDQWGPPDFSGFSGMANMTALVGPINLRSNPSFSSQVLTQIAKGNCVSTSGCRQVSGQLWCRVIWGGHQGFVAKSQLYEGRRILLLSNQCN